MKNLFMLHLMNPYPSKIRKGIFSDISGVMTENLINDENPKEDPYSPKDEDINEDKQESSHKEYKQDTSYQLPKDWKIARVHLLDQILGDIKRGVSTRSQINSFYNYSTFISQIKPRAISDTLLNDGKLLAMQEELIQF